MTQLIVSVRNLVEAKLAASLGVRWIDVKEPSAGSLGATSIAARQQIATALSDHSELILSAADGELHDWSAVNSTAVWNGYRYAKIGLSHGATITDWQARWLEWSQQLGPTTQPVLVYYADLALETQPRLIEFLNLIESAKVSWVLIDTWSKPGPGLLGCLSIKQIQELLEMLHARAVQAVLAGKVQRNEIPRLLELQPAAIAVRGAVCRTESGALSRVGQLCEQRLTDCLRFF